MSCVDLKVQFISDFGNIFFPVQMAWKDGSIFLSSLFMFLFTLSHPCDCHPHSAQLFGTVAEARAASNHSTRKGTQPVFKRVVNTKDYASR